MIMIMKEVEVEINMAKYFPRNNLCVYISRPIRFPMFSYDDHCEDGDDDMAPVTDDSKNDYALNL